MNSRRWSLITAVAAALLVPSAAHGARPDPVVVAKATCQAQANRCYGVDQVLRAYGVDTLHRRGVDGRGTTIAIIMSPSSVLAAGLQQQSRRYGLPAAQLTVAEPVGDPGPLGAILGTQAEANLDVQAAHAIAPRARLLFISVPVAAVNGNVMPDRTIATAIDYAVDAGADVVSMSFGVPERPYPAVRAALARAARAGVAAFTGSGDTGVTTPGIRGRTTVFPASDPHVTAVGGTLLTLDGAGRRLVPDLGWGPDVGGASGGGVARLTRRPAWQRGLAGAQGRGRNYPDISLIAAGSGGFIVFFPGAQIPAVGVSGTSIAAPMMAGITALARQQAGRRLHDVNRAIYALARRPARNGIVDVLLGSNSFSDAADLRLSGTHLVTGYMAAPGYDLVTGVGTIDAPRFVPALARAAR